METKRLFSEIEKFHNRLAIIDRSGQEYSYDQLIALANEQMACIPPDPALIGIETDGNTLHSIATYIGAMRAGHSVILTPGNGLKLGSRIRTTFKPSYIFRFSSEENHFEKNDVSESYSLHPDLAVLLPTSGSTGSPKLVRLSHENLLSNARSIVSYLEIQQDERACMTLPWTYSYGLSVVNSHLISGAAVLLCEEMVTDSLFWDYFNRHQATSFPGVPYTYELLEHSGFLEKELPNLRYFTQAGGKLKQDAVIRFAEYAKQHHKRFYVMYGQTEASPRIAYMPPDKILEYPDCMGQAIPGGMLSLIDEKGEEIHTVDQQGELLYSGPNVMMGYAEDVTDLSKERECGELRTGDLAFRNQAGFYKVVGRTKRFSKIFGLRISLDDVEEVLRNEGIASAVTGDDKGIIVAAAQKGKSDSIRQIVTQRFKLPLSALHIAEYKELPRLNSGKTDYASILAKAREQETSSRSHTRVTSLKKEISEILGVESLNDEDSFTDVGGDSLNYVRIAMLIEKRIGHCPQGWEKMPFRQLENISPTHSWIRWVDTDIIIRAIAISLIVIHHITMLNMTGSALTLMIVAGYNFMRFQVPRLIIDGSLKILSSMLSKVVTLYFIVISIYFIVKKTFFLPQFLLVSNFTQGHFINGKQVLTTWWFIESYIWLVVLFSLLFKSHFIRKLALNHLWRFSLMLFAGSLVLRGIGTLFPHHILFCGKTPFVLAYWFALGGCIAALKTVRQQMVITILYLILIAIFLYDKDIGIYTISIFVLLLIWMPSIPVDQWSGKVISLISLISLYVYISHGFVIHPLRMIFGDSLPPVLWPFTFLGCIAFGAVLWKITEIFWPKTKIKIRNE